jgi:hypothetical protein
MLSQVGGDASAEATLFVLVMPHGWIRRSQAEYNRLIDLNLEDINVSQGTISPQFSRSARTAESYQRLAHLLIGSAFSTAEGTAYKAAYVHTQFQQVRVACALARYRTEHAEFPSSPDKLVPAFLDEVPTDIMDGNPLRYRRTDTGGAAVWSIGQNRIDDGGKTAAKALRYNSPDWVSELPP